MTTDQGEARPRTASARERILAAAERRARAGGYHGFSFRDVAADVGVKSASVHYHFPTKADLAAELARRYTDAAMARLGDGARLTPAAATARVAALFRDALTADDQMCLCGLFGAERDALPDAVADEVAAYFRGLLRFLEAAFAAEPNAPTPESVVARLEGALILARSLRDPEAFDAAIADLEM